VTTSKDAQKMGGVEFVKRFDPVRYSKGRYSQEPLYSHYIIDKRL